MTLTKRQLFAKGGEDGPEFLRAHRLVGAWEFAKLARQAAEMGRYVIAAGDFNSVPHAPPMTIIRDHATLLDAWVESHSKVQSPAISGLPSPVDAIHTYGVTADSPMNSFSAGKPLESLPPAIAVQCQGSPDICSLSPHTEFWCTGCVVVSEISVCHSSCTVGQ